MESIPNENISYVTYYNMVFKNIKYILENAKHFKSIFNQLI